MTAPKSVVLGPVEWLRSGSGARTCACCPDGHHVYGIQLPTPRGAYSKYEHLNQVSSGLHDFARREGMEGASIRVTFERVGDAKPGDILPPEPSEGAVEAAYWQLAAPDGKPEGARTWAQRIRDALRAAYAMDMAGR